MKSLELLVNSQFLAYLLEQLPPIIVIVGVGAWRIATWKAKLENDIKELSNRIDGLSGNRSGGNIAEKPESSDCDPASPDTADKPEITHTDILVLLKAIGMKTFVDCFDDYSAKNDIRKTEVSILCRPDSNNWKENTLNTKTTTLKRIFRENRQCEALQLCREAQRLPTETNKKANELYKKLCI